MARSLSPVDRVVGAIVPRAVGALDPDDLVRRIDVGELVGRLDVDALVGRVDLDALVQRVDMDALVACIDVDALVQRVDVDALVQRVDVDALVQRVDVDALVQRVDVDALVQRVDVDALVSRVDLVALLGRVDLDAVLAEVDINALLEGVDVGALARRAGIDQIVAEATTGLVSRTLGVARRQLAAIDAALLGVVDRLLRREPSPEAVAGHRAAGPLGRVLGFLADSFVVSTLFGLAAALGGTLLELFTGRSFDTAGSGGPAWWFVFAAWWFLYLWLTIGLSGRTVGKGLVGLRITALDGTLPTPRQAAVRALVFPVSFVLGLGFVPAVLGRQRRAFHDLVAGTIEVVDPGPHGEAPASSRWGPTVRSPG